MEKETMTESLMDTENDNSAFSSEETNEIDPTQSSPEDNQEMDTQTDKDEPFHKRWKKQTDDWKDRFNQQEERHLMEIEKIREEMTQKFQPVEKPSKEIPEWFNGDEALWDKFEQWNENLVSKIQEKKLAEMAKAKESQEKAVEEATNYFYEQVDLLENDPAINPSGSKVDQNKLQKIVLDNELIDSQGRWNWKAGMMILNAQNIAPTHDTTKRKQFADTTMGSKFVDTKPREFKTSKDFENPGSRIW